MTPVSLSCKSIALRAAVGRWSSIAMSMILSRRSIARSTLPCRSAIQARRKVSTRDRTSPSVIKTLPRCRAPWGEYPASRAAWARLAPRATWRENNSLRDDSGRGEDDGLFGVAWESMAEAFGGRDDVRLFYRERG